ncbi:MAG: hypothetical protein ACI30J_01320 [Paludibacteraceae bacterium]
MSILRLIELNNRFACRLRKAILPAILLASLLGVGTLRGEQWEKVADAEELVDGGIYAILTYDSMYFLANDATSSQAPLAQVVSKSNGEIIWQDNMLWRAVQSNGGFWLESNSKNKVYVYGGKNSGDVRVNTLSYLSDATKLWYAEADSRYGVVLYNNAADKHRYLSAKTDILLPDWRNYTDKSYGSIGVLYKQRPTMYVVTWLLDGKPYSAGDPTTMVASGQQVTILPLPPKDDALACADTFMGWSTHRLGTMPAQVMPADLFTTAADSPAITGDTTFYAVFATKQE